MARPIRALIVDDDPHAAEMLATRLRHEIPTLDITLADRPEPAAGHDIYLIDNDFDGIKLGTRLAKELRAVSPEALIVAFSGTLDAKTLKELLNAGCNGACEKGDDHDFATLVTLAKQVGKEKPRNGESGNGLVHVMRSLADLLKQWNNRLDRMESR